MFILFLEIFAVFSAILYLILAAKEDIKCWYAALFSSALYMYIMYTAGLIMESFLQIFYICMAIYGWYIWSNKINEEQELKITSWKKRYHVYAIIIVTLLAIISGFLLEKYTQAALPFLDAFTTWGAIITTYMVAKKIIENSKKGHDFAARVFVVKKTGSTALSNRAVNYVFSSNNEI